VGFSPEFCAAVGVPARRSHAEKQIPKTEDFLAERVEFELSGDFLNGQ